MAESRVREYRKVANEDPDGEGFDFQAAESGVSPWEYFQGMVYSYVGEFYERLSELAFEAQKEYVRKLEAGEAIEPLY